MRKVLFLILLLFLGINVGLGYYYYKFLRQENKLGQINSSTPTAQIKLQISNLLLNLPGPGTSKEQQKEFIVSVSTKAQSADRIEIANCKPKPLITKISRRDIKFVNKDTADHLIIFNDKQKYTIKAGQSVPVPVNSSPKPQAFPFICDSPPTAGIIFVPPK